MIRACEITESLGAVVVDERAGAFIVGRREACLYVWVPREAEILSLREFRGRSADSKRN